MTGSVRKCSIAFLFTQELLPFTTAVASAPARSYSGFDYSIAAFVVAQASEPAVSPTSESAWRPIFAGSTKPRTAAGWEACDTAGSEACATNRLNELVSSPKRSVRADGRGFYRCSRSQDAWEGRGTVPAGLERRYLAAASVRQRT